MFLCIQVSGLSSEDPHWNHLEEVTPRSIGDDAIDMLIKDNQIAYLVKSTVLIKGRGTKNEK